MSIKRKMLGAAAVLTMVGVLSAVEALSASAASPACGSQCGSVFSRELGTYAQPNVVEDVLDGVARVGQPVILKQASGSDPSEDIIPHRESVSGFFAAGMVSAAVNEHYGSALAVQQEYAPFGVGTGLCVGLPSVAYQNEGLTLRPCTVPGVTVFIVDTHDSPTTAADGYFPIVKARRRTSAVRLRWTYRKTRLPARIRHSRFASATCSSSPTRRLCPTDSCGDFTSAS